MRLFTAILIAPHIVEVTKQAQHSLKQVISCKRWQPLSHLHITLHFLGEVRDKESEDIQACIGASLKAIESSPIQLGLGPLGVFPNIRRPSVLWLGLEGNLEGLNELYQRVGEPLSSWGYKMDSRAYKSHITLAREPYTKGPELEAVINRTELPKLYWETKEFHLIQSELLASGPKYTTLRSYSL
jgi:2'-5' RNA ligase